MRSGIDILSECDGLSRRAQFDVLSRRAPGLRIGSGSTPNEGPCSFLIVATWARLDREALDHYLRLGGARALALHEWFTTKEEVRRVTGYEGGCFQSPILVLRDASGAIEWQGEGHFAREELKARARRD